MIYQTVLGKRVEMDNPFMLIGVINVFMNRYQIMADRFFGEISWKQCFLLICLGLFETPPTLREVADVMGTSHQNVKQMLLKLEKLGFVDIAADAGDKRKQRILLTQKTQEFNREHDKPSAEVVGRIFASISPADLETTVKTFLQMEKNLEEMEQNIE